MANYNKSFNFRNGVQVDNDNFVVNANGLVGIGTTIPTDFLDVYGTSKFNNSISGTDITLSGTTSSNKLRVGVVSITSGIITASSGIVTYYGDGGKLLNLPTSQWVDVDSGFGYTSIFSRGNVGIATIYPNYTFQVGNNPDTNFGVGFNSTGSIKASGIITAYSFSGFGTDLQGLNASYITNGTLTNSRLPQNINVSGIITAVTNFSGNLNGNINSTGLSTFSGGISGNLTGNVNSTGLSTFSGGISGNLTGNVNSSGLSTFSGGISGNLTGNVNSTGLSTFSGGISGNLTGNVNSSGVSTFSGGIIGNVTGIASTARSLTGTPDISVGIVTASTFNIGVAGTILSLTSNGRIGIGSNLPSQAIQIVGNQISTIEVVGKEARLILAQEKSNISIASSAGFIRYGNSDKTFELLNQAPGNFNLYLHSGDAGINTGRFGWVYGQNFNELMSLTYTGRLGLGKTNPDHTLHVVGTSTVTGNAWFGGDVTIAGDLNIPNIQLPSIIENSNIYVTSGVSTFNNINAVKIGINTNSPTVDIDAKFSTALFSSAGIGTDVLGEAKLRVGGFSQFASIGIGTTTLYDVPGDGSSGILQVHNNAISVFSGSLLIDNSPLSSIGFGTFISKSILDFGNVGAAASIGFMILPTLTSTQRSNLSYNLNGSLIFNSSAQEFQGYANNAWTNLGITTANIKANAVNVSGIVTATNGFLSGVGTAVQITTVGNKLFFTVPGVGTTSLTLF